MLPYEEEICFSSVDFPICPTVPCRGPMNRIDLDYWYTFGRAMSLLEECFAITPCDLSVRDWSRINTAVAWLAPIVKGNISILPGTQHVAHELLLELVPLIAANKNVPARVSDLVQAKIFHLITAFHNAMRIGARDTYAFLIPDEGAYSAKALMENSVSHLSELAQKTISKSEAKDFNLAGCCYACGLPTACGFHAMRALEAEARRFHKAVTGVSEEVEWTLDSLVNGNSGRKQFGLRDQWKKEGARDDSPLLLIISLLSSINQIYRNPIMHPEMLLNTPQAKKVFDTGALVISSMVEERTKRETASPGVTDVK